MSIVEYDISGEIRDFLAGYSTLTKRVDERIFHPVFFGQNGATGYEEEKCPKVMFKQVSDRYLFVVEAETTQDAREVAVILKNALQNGAMSLKGGTPQRTIVLCALPEGGMNDSRNEVNNKPQIFFYMNFEAI